MLCTLGVVDAGSMKCRLYIIMEVFQIDKREQEEMR